MQELSCGNCRAGVRLDTLEESQFFHLRPIPAVDMFEKTLKQSQEHEVYPLGVYECPNCRLVQVIESPPSDLFYDNYIYTSTSSPDMADNFVDLQSVILPMLNSKKSKLKVLDIGCNDGGFLRLFGGDDRYALHGTDPSPVAAKAVDDCYTLYEEYFPGRLTKNGGPYDLIVGTNSLAHIPNVGDCFASIKAILAPGGILVIEVSDFNEMVARGAWDYIYHEHLYYYTEQSLADILISYQLEVFRCDSIATKGGSLRVFARHQEIRDQSSRTGRINLASRTISELKSKYYKCMAAYDVLQSQVKEHSSVYGYGACATGTVTIAQHKLFGEIEYLIDDNPDRQNRFAPYWAKKVRGLHQIKFSDDDIVIVFAWRFYDRILENIHGYCAEQSMPMPRVVRSISLDLP
jgi:SAM-dependent methyltransferase